MRDKDENVPSRPSSRAHAARGPSLIRALSLAALLFLAFYLASSFFGRSGCAGRDRGPESVTIIEKTPDVVVALRELAFLEGMVFHTERVIDLRERQSTLFRLIDAEDAILLVAAGEVRAGVDLRALTPSAIDADFEERRATLYLPAATISSARLDNARTYVHSRKTDLFASRRQDLETRARREAERSLEQAAREAGILEKAEASVGRTIEGLLRSLGFEQIEVHFGVPRAGEEPLLIPALGSE